MPINDIVDEIDDEIDEDDYDICPRCNGSGEGMYDGTTCRVCKGSGVEPHVRDDWEY